MKLYFVGTSPFVRKVMACAIARGVDQQITALPTRLQDSPADLLADNPLGKVPCLITDDGLALFDSPVICEYLDTRGDALPLFPEHGAARWRALKQQALGDGILDAAVARRGETTRPKEAARDALMARYRGVVERSLAALEADPPHKPVDIGSITVACALGYLDFRFAAEPWRPGHPKLAAWFEAFSQEPAIARTTPRE
ncbi:MAG TPA: glutathione S-transferase N-terminal domain-containing protein [Acetobacteraceae bacterium]|jgi:glutathione S-transferase